MKKTTLAALALLLLAAGLQAAEGTKEFTLVAVQVEKAKFWLPSTIIVKKGDKVKLTLKNQIPGEARKPETLVHGFAIDEFDALKVVKVGEDVVVEFTASKTGLFRMYCQLHPAHIGGQLLVID